MKKGMMIMSEAKKVVTLDDLAALPREYLKTSEVADVLGTTLYAPVLMAKEHAFPFAVPFSGNRPKYPKRAFLEWMGWKEA